MTFTDVFKRDVNQLFCQISCFKKFNDVNGLDRILLGLQQLHQDRFTDKVKPYDIFAKPFTAKKFYEICAGEGLDVDRRELPPIRKTILGFYSANDRIIWLKPRQSKTTLLHTMAHELAHHFLHREKILNKELPGNTLFQKTDILDERILLAEFEAELFACVFLVAGRKVD